MVRLLNLDSEADEQSSLVPSRLEISSAQQKASDENNKGDAALVRNVSAAEKGALPSRKLSEVRSSIATNLRGAMSPREARAHVLRRAFSKYDMDKSGSIDRHELQILLKDLGWSDDESSVTRILHVFGEDDTGAITYEEFFKWTEFAFASRVLCNADLFRQSWSKLLSDEGASPDDLNQSTSEHLELDNSCRSRRSSCRSTLEVISEDGNTVCNQIRVSRMRDLSGKGNLEKNYGRRCSGINFNLQRSFSRPLKKLEFETSRNSLDEDDIGNSSGDDSIRYGDGILTDENVEMSEVDIIAHQRMKQRTRGCKVRAKSVGVLCSEANARCNRASMMGVSRELRTNSKVASYMRWTVEQFLESSNMINESFVQRFKHAPAGEKVETSSCIEESKRSRVGHGGISVRFHDNVRVEEFIWGDDDENCGEDDTKLSFVRKTKTK